jgi:hypothetical protein
MMATETGIGVLTGCDASVVVRYDSASRRWVSDFEEDASER